MEVRNNLMEKVIICQSCVLFLFVDYKLAFLFRNPLNQSEEPKGRTTELEISTCSLQTACFILCKFFNALNILCMLSGLQWHCTVKCGSNSFYSQNQKYVVDSLGLAGCLCGQLLHSILSSMMNYSVWLIFLM